MLNCFKPNVEEFETKIARYFSKRFSSIPQGLHYNCCESVLLILAERLSVKSGLIPRVIISIDALFSLTWARMLTYFWGCYGYRFKIW